MLQAGEIYSLDEDTIMRPEKSSEKGAKDPSMDIVDQVESAGMKLPKEMVQDLKDDPDGAKRKKLEEAIGETASIAAVATMYRQVGCGGCRAVTELLANDLLAGWQARPGAKHTLDRVQRFCGSSAFPGDYQVTTPNATANEKGHVKYVLERMEVRPEDAAKLSEAEQFTAAHSEQALQRICREVAEENDEEISEMAVGVMKKGRPQQLQQRLEKALCKRLCKARRGKAPKGRAAPEL